MMSRAYEKSAPTSRAVPKINDWTCPPPSPIASRTRKRTKGMSPRSSRTVPSRPKKACGLNMMNERMIADADLAMCCQMLEKRRDSRVFSLVVTGMETIDIRLCPAWMIVSMQ